MTLEQAIEKNRVKWARWHRAEKVLRAIRVRIFDYEDEGKLEKAHRVIETCKRILAPMWHAQQITRDNIKLNQTPSAFECGS